jgi:hypothetical protein
MDLDRRQSANLNKTNIRTKKILFTLKGKTQKSKKNNFQFQPFISKTHLNLEGLV